MRNTRADGIHMTDGVHDGVVQHPTVSGSGDDGVAVVSYMRDSAPCARITVNSPRVVDQVRGRGISVVGGEDIAYNDVDIESSNSAAVYVAVEGNPFFTRNVSGVTVQGGRLWARSRTPRSTTARCWCSSVRRPRRSPRCR